MSNTVPTATEAQASALPAPPLPATPWARAGLRAQRLAIQAEAFLPVLARSPHPPAPVTAGAPTLSVLAANLAQGVHDVDALARAVVDVDADVICLVEHTEATSEALARAGLDERWPEVSDAHEDGYFGTLVAARRPCEEITYRGFGGRPGQVVDFMVEGVLVRVVPVHTQAPVLDRDVAVWRSSMEATAAVADGAPGPVVLAGDWNATGGHRRFRRTLRRHGLVDAQAALGRRWLPTWPVPHPKSPGPRWLPPLLPLDHVVVSSGVAVEALDAVALPGSDHLGLRAVLRLG